jgi:hypothetical protein
MYIYIIIYNTFMYYIVHMYYVVLIGLHGKYRIDMAISSAYRECVVEIKNAN